MKRQAIMRALLLLLLLVAAAGCATMADAVKARGTGTSVAYLASFDDVWRALPTAIKDAGLDFVSANKEDRSVLAQRGISAFSYGENVAIFVDPLETAKSQVEVVTKKAMNTNIFAPNWAKPIFEQLDKKFSRAN